MAIFELTSRISSTKALYTRDPLIKNLMVMNKLWKFL